MSQANPTQWDKTIEANYKPVLSHYDVTALALHKFYTLNNLYGHKLLTFDLIVSNLCKAYSNDNPTFNATKFKDLIYNGNPE